MTAIHTIEQIRQIEAHTFKQFSSFSIMEQAGCAVAALAQTMVKPAARIIVITGTGNNGGDGYIAAHTLQQNGYNVAVIGMAKTNTLPQDAQTAAMQWCKNNTVTVLTNQKKLPKADLYIDALLGIGLKNAVRSCYQPIIAAINNSNTPVLSIDIPSGVCADTGRVLSCAVSATATITFFSAKAGLYTGEGVDYAGNIHHCPLLKNHPIVSGGRLINTSPDIQFLNRKKNTHKGHYGHIYLIGGASGMVGALVLASRAAASMGAGKTTAVAMSTAVALDFIHPEIMWATTSNLDFENADVIAIGMGLGQSDKAVELLTTTLATKKTILLDADAINLLAQHSQLKQQLQQRQYPTVLTPHPTEAARLIGSSTEQINANRIAAAQDIACQTNAITVLKGAGTIIAQPSAQYYICTAGNSGLARAGSGDVLAGLLATLLAQTICPIQAVCAGVCLHATAADNLAAKDGQVGLNINQIAPEAARIADGVDN